MKQVRYLILGAGPSGLTVGNRLLQKGISDFLILEKEDSAGGLCRSINIDGSPLDIGGGHFLDVREKKVTDFLFSFLPKSKWNLFRRNSQIQLRNCVIDNPIESNIWQMDLESQVEYLKAIAVAGCNLDLPKPKKFIDWIYWKLGNKIAEEYMIPYNKKMFGEQLNTLGTYWLDKLPNVSFEETLLSCLAKKSYGKQPAHTEFYYPSASGYGDLWDKMAEKIKDKIIYSCDVKKIDFNERIVNEKCQADYIISTIPWCDIDSMIGIPEKLRGYIGDLKYSSVVINYNSTTLNSKAHWIYYPMLNLDYHRILLRSNFYAGARGHWTETNLNRFKHNKQNSEYYHVNKYAYPLNTLAKPQKISELLKWASEKQVYGLGRWGEWQHYNSDVVVKHALTMTEKFS